MLPPLLQLLLLLSLSHWAPGDQNPSAKNSRLQPQLLAVPCQMGWLKDLSIPIPSVSLKAKRQLWGRARGKMPKSGTGGSSLKLYSSKGEFQADSLILIYLKLPAEPCWKLGNSPCLMWIRAALGLILNRVQTFLFQLSGDSIWTLHQEDMKQLWQPPREQGSSHHM